ncbi:hypothetical protein KBC80_02735 [Candidatus Woesebacteria bacterium]|nr:hypothetical protein [Candidatus Woesebacteria bacterium]
MALFVERDVKPFDATKLASYDASRAPISFSIDRSDPTYFANWKQWQQEPVGVDMGARTVKIRADVFKHAAHRVPINETAYVAFTPRSQGETPVYTPAPDKLPIPMSPAMAIAAGLGIMGDLALGAMAARSKNKAAISSWLLLQAPIINGCQTAIATPAAEVTSIPAEITQAAPATTTVETATSTPPPGFQTETPVAPSDIIGSHPDYKDVSIGGVAFTHGATEAQIADASNPLGLPEYAVVAYAENIEAIQGKVEGEQSAQVFWNKTFDRNFVLLSRVEAGVTQVAVIAAGEENFSYHPNAEWFDFTATENPAYTWVALPAGVVYTDLVGGYFGDYPVWGIQKPSETTPSQLFVPGAEHGFEQNPAKPVEVAKFSIDSLELSAEITAALKKHAGLEASITAEAGGFTTQITYWDANQNLVTEKVNIDPSGLTEDLANKNKFGKTPTMSTIDGQTLLWSQEHKGWFKQFEVSSDINAPVFVPLEYRDVLIRDILLHEELNQPFSNAAIERWKVSAGLTMGFQYLDVNVNTGTSTKFGYLENSSAVTWDGLTKDNSPIQALDAWYYTVLPDGTKFQFFPTKWLDPLLPHSPNPDEWKIMLVASGEEIMGDATNRTTFDKLWENAANMNSKLEILPIFKIEDGFFNDTNGLITFGASQPSLAKLLKLKGNDMGNLPNPGHDGNPYNYTFGFHFPNLSATNPNIVVGIGQDDPKYVNGFFPADIQTILFPSLIVQR